MNNTVGALSLVKDFYCIKVVTMLISRRINCQKENKRGVCVVCFLSNLRMSWNNCQSVVFAEQLSFSPPPFFVYEKINYRQLGDTNDDVEDRGITRIDVVLCDNGRCRWFTESFQFQWSDDGVLQNRPGVHQKLPFKS